MTRRAMLAGALVPALSPLRVSAAAVGPRIAALDWGLAATVTALGAGPAAAAEMAGYAQWVREPALPTDTVELGLRVAPSFETLAGLRPDLILVNALNAGQQQRLERIAPTYANTVFAEGGDPLVRAVAATRDLGTRLGRSAQAETLIAHAATRFVAARDRLAGKASRPLVALSFIDGRHARVYGRGSLPASVMERVGLNCGWTRPTNSWGFSVLALEALAACPDTDFLVVAPLSADARRAMGVQGLWTGLLAANRARAITLPAIWVFGDLTAAARCADLLAEALATPARSEALVDD